MSQLIIRVPLLSIYATLFNCTRRHDWPFLEHFAIQSYLLHTATEVIRRVSTQLDFTVSILKRNVPLHILTQLITASPHQGVKLVPALCGGGGGARMWRLNEDGY